MKQAIALFVTPNGLPSVAYRRVGRPYLCMATRSFSAVSSVISACVTKDAGAISHYPGVAEAVRQGDFASGLQHYELFGAGEGRVICRESEGPHRDLLLGFCSLGYNCEFGIAQRAFGVEPMDLFRWALTPSNVLIHLLVASFERIGDPTEIEVYPSPSGEYHIRHKGYQFGWHAWANVGETTPERLRNREAKRLPYLSRKLMEDMADGARIFVVTHADMTLDTAKRILVAMHRYGRPTLMYATEGSPLGVTKESDCLLHATIPKFADKADVPGTIASGDWLSVCEKARAIQNSSDMDLGTAMTPSVTLSFRTDPASGC